MVSSRDSSRAPVQSADALLQRLLSLQALLSDHDEFWRRSPFHEETPAWTQERPALRDALLALRHESVVRLSTDPGALQRWLSDWMPAIPRLSELCEVPRFLRPPAGPDRFFAHVPGAKRAQVEAFASAVSNAGVGGHPWLEWCAGKGHLGRWLAHQSGRSVRSVEWNADLCSAGRALADRTGSRQEFRCLDVLALSRSAEVPNRHVVALHACGDLHLRLLEHVAEAPVPALDLAPCCYDRTQRPVYQALNIEAELAPDRLALRLAVTDMRTGRRRHQRWRRQQLAWKLAYKVAREEHTGRPATAPLASIPRTWACLSFPDWCRALARRDGFEFPAAIDWAGLEALGGSLRYRFERLNLARLAFRRALEMWLVLDIALFLTRQGYEVSLAAFCPDTLTPRNLIVSARDRTSTWRPQSVRPDAEP